MTRKTHLSLVGIFILSISLVSFSKKDEQVVGKLIFRIGKVSLLNNQSESKYISLNDDIYLNNKIETKSEARCEIKLNDGSILKVNENTLLKIDKSFTKFKEKRTSLQLFFGSIWLKVKKLVTPTDEFSIRTTVGVAAVRGTDFKMSMTKDSTLTILVDEGVVDAGEALMLRDFDTFADFLKGNEAAFEAWKNKNNGEEFYKNELKEFQAFQKKEDEDFQNFVNGTTPIKKAKKEWVKSILAGEKIVISTSGYQKSKMTETDSIKGF